MMNSLPFTRHLQAILLSLYSLVRSPESIPSHILETVSEWTRARNWKLIWGTLLFLVMNVGLWTTAAFVAFRSPSSIVQSSMKQVNKRFAQQDLVKLAFDEHYIRNGVKDRVDTLVPPEVDEQTGRAIVRPQLVADEDLINSPRFRETEALLMRAIQVSPESVQAKFQLALLKSLDTRLEKSAGGGRQANGRTGLGRE